MDIKLKTSEMLLRKLESGCGDAQLHAVAEIRLFSKWDESNRTSLAKAGAVSLLLKMLQTDTRAHPRVQENAMAALVNLSINTEVKLSVASEKLGLDVIMHLANDGETSELRAGAAALLYSLLVDDASRKIVCCHEKLGETLQSLLKDGSSSCKAEALKAMFVLAKEAQTRDNLLQEKLGLIATLVSLLTAGKVKLTEDCLAVLALLAGCEAGAKAVMAEASTLTILVYLLSRGGSPRAQENAAAVLLSICLNYEAAKGMLPMDLLIPALMRLKDEGSDRGKLKAEALVMMLGFEHVGTMGIDPSVLMDDSKISYGSSFYNGTETSRSTEIPFDSMPAAQIDDLSIDDLSSLSEPAVPSKDVMPGSLQHAASSEPAFSGPSAGGRRFHALKYVSLAKKVFTPKARKESLKSVNQGKP